MSGGSSQSSHSPLVLLIDDDTELLLVLELLLTEQGFHVVTALNGRLALKKLEFLQPDVIVTDMVMPELDGLEFLRVYGERPGARAPVLAVSSFASYLEQTRLLGAAATLRKPYESDVLTTKIRELSEKRLAPQVSVSVAEEVDERTRLRAVFELRIADAAPEAELPRFLDEVAATFAVPIAGISAVTHDRQRLVVRCSTASHDTGRPREASFCTHAVAARSALVIQDASQNPLFRSNSSVAELGFRFYAGVPLVAPHGEAVGTLCILDYVPRRFTYFDLELLSVLSRRVLAALDRRDQRQNPGAPAVSYRYLNDVDEDLDIYGRALFSDLLVVEASRHTARGQLLALAGVAAPRQRLATVISAIRAEVPESKIGRIGQARIAALLPHRDSVAARKLAERCAVPEGRAAAVQLADYEGALGLALLHVEQLLGDAGLRDQAAPPDYRHA